MPGTLWQETLALGEDYISLCCSSRWLAHLPPSQSAAAMRHLAEDMERQNQADLHDLAQRLMRQGPDPCANLSRVMAEVSGDGHLNWGRVVSIFSFAGVVAKQLQEQQSHQVRRGEEAEEDQDYQEDQEAEEDQEEQEEQASMNHRLAVAIADYLAGEKRDWLLEHNGWDGFVEFYRNAAAADNNPSVKTALYAAAGVGLAGLTFLAARKVSTYIQVVFQVLLSRNP